MRFTELQELVRDYDNVMHSDEYMEVRFGCDCGCGGDFYEDNVEAWDNMVSENAEILERIKAKCLELNIEYDGV